MSVIRPGPVECTVSRGSPGNGRSGAGLRTMSLAYRPAATAAAPAPITVVAAAAAAVPRRILPSVDKSGGLGQWAGAAG